MFANRIKSLRPSKELNQVQLAKKLGVKKQSIGNRENGNMIPSIGMLEKISDFFCFSTDYLLGRDEKPAGGVQTMDVTGLTLQQAKHISDMIDDFRQYNH